MAIFIHCNKEECPAAKLPTTATLLSRCHCRCHEASTVLPLSPPCCRHVRPRAVANATVTALTPPPRFRCRRCHHFYRRCSPCRQCHVAAAVLSPPPPCRSRAITATLLPRCRYRPATNGCREAATRAVATAAFAFIVVVAAAATLLRCQRWVVGGGHFNVWEKKGRELPRQSKYVAPPTCG